jgi:dihydrolipoamide dehydrogenase
VADSVFDVVVIGSGPGGYEAAVHAAQFGKRAACVEKAELGGICLNWGCIPTKALIHDAHIFSRGLAEAQAFGITVDKSKLQWDTIVARSRAVAHALSIQIGFLFKKNGVASYQGTGLVKKAEGAGGGAAGGTFAVEVRDAEGKVTQTLPARKILACTGARNKEFPGMKVDGKSVLSSREAMVLKEVPGRMVIIGAGAIGVEFAYIYESFGARITLVEMMDRLLPIEDTEVSSRLETIFKKRGMDVRTKTKTDHIETTANGVRVTVSSDGKQEILEADKALLAIGVTGNVEGVFAPDCLPEVVKGHFKVGQDFQTSVPGVYAAGDVIGPPWLAHVATMEAKIAIEHMFGLGTRQMDYGIVPGCTYCMPQVASVGLTERACQERKLDYQVGKWQFAASGRALAANAPDGFVKLIFGKPYGELLGAHMLGAEVTELLAELVLAMRLEATRRELETTLHAHPTLSEAVMTAAGNVG